MDGLALEARVVPFDSEAAAGPPAAPSRDREVPPIAHVLTCGSVDDGKSTLIGRLLWDAGHVPDDVRAQALAAGRGGLPDLSQLVDGLIAEREQGITIDIAWRYLDIGAQRLVIIDSPGHEQYTRNMASGASHADVAVLLVDARSGLKVQTARHAAILALVGVKRLVVAVNKMDLVDWSEARFRTIAAELETLANGLRFAEAVAIPLSARFGDNVAQRSDAMAWYRGPTLLDVLATAGERTRRGSAPFRMAVQTVLHHDGDFRALAGVISSGKVAPGDAIRDVLSGREAKVVRVVTFDRDLPVAVAGQSVALTLDRDLDVSRGSVIAAETAETRRASQMTARLVWLADAPLDAGRGLLFRTATDLVPVTALEVVGRLDLDTLHVADARSCTTNDIVDARIHLGRFVALDRFADNRETGSFLLVDALSGRTVAGGIVSAISEPDAAGPVRGFTLTAAMLQQGLCRDLLASDREFRRRAEEASLLLSAAGVAVTLDLGGT